MKEERYTSLICKNFCHYYKLDKESDCCGGYFYLQTVVTASELNSLIEIFHLNDDISADRGLSFICDFCDFREEDCDFFVNKSVFPCGGYLIVSRLLRCLNF